LGGDGPTKFEPRECIKKVEPATGRWAKGGGVPTRGKVVKIGRKGKVSASKIGKVGDTGPPSGG